jgi:hypothetical protein
MPLYLWITIAVVAVAAVVGYVVYVGFKAKKDHPNVEGPY